MFSFLSDLYDPCAHILPGQSSSGTGAMLRMPDVTEVLLNNVDKYKTIIQPQNNTRTACTLFGYAGYVNPKQLHSDVIKWKHFPLYRTKASDTELWCIWSPPELNGWVNSGEAGDLRRHHAHYDVIVMYIPASDE